MSTRQRPLPASCVYFDRQRYSLGVPLIAKGLDRLYSSSPWVSTWPPTRQGHLVPDGTESTGLLRSAEPLLRGRAPVAASDALDDFRVTVADLVWQANTGVGA
jgi:hypothetical protein